MANAKNYARQIQILPTSTTISFRSLCFLWLTFLVIQLNVAFRLPLTGVEIEAARQGVHPFVPDIVAQLAALGATLVGEPMGQRLAFVICAALTCALASRLSTRFSDAPLAPALTLLWLNITCLFGLGAIHVGPASIAALLFAITLLGYSEYAFSQKWRWLALSGLSFPILVLLQPEFAVAGIGILSATLLLRSFSEFRSSPGFWVTLFVPMGLSLVVANDPLSSSISAIGIGRSIAIAVLLISPPIVALGLSGMFSSFKVRNDTEVPRALVAFALLPLLIFAPIADAGLTLVVAALPPLVVLAVIKALESATRIFQWITELATPVAMFIYAGLIGLLLHPANSISPHIPVLRDFYGWEPVAEQVDILTASTTIEWAMAEDPDVATKLLPFASHYVSNQTDMWQEMCNSNGIYILEADKRHDVFGKFSQITFLFDVAKPGGKTFAFYLVGGATRVLGCPALSDRSDPDNL